MIPLRRVKPANHIGLNRRAQCVSLLRNTLRGKSYPPSSAYSASQMLLIFESPSCAIREPSSPPRSPDLPQIPNSSPRLDRKPATRIRSVARYSGASPILNRRPSNRNQIKSYHEEGVGVGVRFYSLPSK